MASNRGRVLPRPRVALNLLAAVLFCFVALFAVTTAEGRSSSPRQVICDVFGPRCKQALRVARCESNFNPRAVSRTRDVGLFQANFSAHGGRLTFEQFRRRMVDPRRNTEFAYRLSRSGTRWGAWRWSRHCHGLA